MAATTKQKSKQLEINQFFKQKRHYVGPKEIHKPTVENENRLSDKALLASKDKTPEGKIIESIGSFRKRKWEGKDSISGSPPKKHRLEPSSVRKKLLMNKDETDSSSYKKLTPQEIKEKLGKCGRLDELHAKLVRVNDCEKKLRDFKNIQEKNYKLKNRSFPVEDNIDSPTLKKFSAINVEVPVSPLKSPFKSPTPRKTSVASPAFQKYHHLADKSSEELTLPFKYKFIKEVFRAVDTVVSLLHNRQEVITYSKLKPAVQEVIRKAFYTSYLGQIKTVFPLAYFFNQEKIKLPGHSDAKYDLTVCANLNYKGLATRNLLSAFDNNEKPSISKFRKMDSGVLVERRNIFHNSLVDIIKEHHNVFLQSLDLPIDLQNAKIARWHPAFPMEDIPDIETCDLPKPPVENTISGAKDIIGKAQELFGSYHRLDKAVQDAATQKVNDGELLPEVAIAPTVDVALKGISQSLLEKVRAREALKARREMTRSRQENKELEMLSRFPEIARILRNVFISEKKPALAWDFITSKICSSYPSTLANSEVDDHLNMLCKLLPDWCVIHRLKCGTFVKINKNTEFSQICSQIEKIINDKK